MILQAARKTAGIACLTAETTMSSAADLPRLITRSAEKYDISGLSVFAVEAAMVPKARKIMSSSKAATKIKDESEEKLRIAAQQIMPKGVKLRTLAKNSPPPAEWWDEPSPF